MPHAASTMLALAAVTSTGCASRESAPDLTAAHAAAIEDSVRSFAQAVADDVTREGPVAWRRHFAESPAFFMASEGRLVLPNSEVATRVIQELARSITRIELRWGDGLRVDPLAPGLAVLAAPYHEVRVDTARHRVEESGFFTGLVEHGTGPWRLRNAHWSVAGPPPLVR
jgi:hypothetical protein